MINKPKRLWRDGATCFLYQISQTPAWNRQAFSFLICVNAGARRPISMVVVGRGLFVSRS